jgi:hypothetical protein
MKPDQLKHLIANKQKWTEPLTPEETDLGFKGWYIENNPVKAGLVKAPEDWLWSSAHYRGVSGPVVPVLTHSTAKRMPPPNP